MLEASDLTNAGLGSSLSLDGRAACDASVSHGGSFGAVGCVRCLSQQTLATRRHDVKQNGSNFDYSGLKHPIAAAYTLCRERKEGRMTLGRLRPALLTGEGAREWAVEHGVGETCAAEDLVSFPFPCLLVYLF